MTKNTIILFILLIISLSVLAYNFSFRSEIENVTSVSENIIDAGFDKNASIVNNSTNKTNNSTENIMLISLEKPSEEVIGG